MRQKIVIVAKFCDSQIDSVLEPEHFRSWGPSLKEPSRHLTFDGVLRIEGVFLHPWGAGKGCSPWLTLSAHTVEFSPEGIQHLLKPGLALPNGLGHGAKQNLEHR